MGNPDMPNNLCDADNVKAVKAKSTATA